MRLCTYRVVFGRDIPQDFHVRAARLLPVGTGSQEQPRPIDAFPCAA